MRPARSLAALAAIWTTGAALAQSTTDESMSVRSGSGLHADCNLLVGDYSGSRQLRDLVARPRRHFLEVTVLTGLPDTAASVDATFDAASTLVQQDTGANDATCCATILRDGAVNVVAPPAGMADGVIDTATDRNNVRALPGDVKVVAAINFCSMSGSFAGCQTGGSLILTTGFAASTLAHEIGHREGLGHVGSNCTPSFGGQGNCPTGCPASDASVNNIMWWQACGGPDFTSGQCSGFQGGASR